jgi:hypothetical protein
LAALLDLKKQTLVRRAMRGILWFIIKIFGSSWIPGWWILLMYDN